MLAGPSFAATRPPDAPHLPPGFGKTFTSRFVNAGGLRQHIVIGGEDRRCCSCTAGPRTGTSTGR
jgi:hypothetical protein